MEPEHDLVCCLLETPFTIWKEVDKKDLLLCQQPQPSLSSIRPVSSTSKPQRTRNFQNSWYVNYPWLCGSRIFQKLFCWPCLLIGVKNGTWNRVGFDSISTATRSFKKHEGSSEHIKNSVGLKELKKNQNQISDALRENARLFVSKFNENVRLNRLLMCLPINAVLFLSKQELAFRGHSETTESLNRGNFKELLKLLVDSSPLEIKQQYEKVKSVFHGDSKTTQNELIECMAGYIKEFIKSELSEAPFFSVQVDDTTDIAQKSQCSVIVRYVNTKGVLVERFLGFYDVSADRTAQALFNLLDTILGEFSYRNKLVAQCYDGASVMAGNLNGLQMKIKEQAPQAVFVHCLAHRLNLVLKQSICKLQECRIFFASLSGIPSFFHHSAKRTYVADSTIGRRIPSGVETRWSSHSKLLSVVVQDWDGLKQIFQKIIDDPESDERSVYQCRGFLYEFNTFEFAIMSFIFNDIFEVANILFNVLQKKALDIGYCVSKIRESREIILKKRIEETFQKYFELAQEKTEVPATRRSRFQTKEEIYVKYKALFYEILDIVIMEIDVRFQDVTKLQFLSLGDSTKFEYFSKKFPTDALESLKLNCSYSSMFDFHRLKNELEFIYSGDDYKNISIEKIVTLLNENDMKDVFKEAYKLFCVILTLPSTSCSVERSFSCLKRIKTYLRNKTSQERLTELTTISLEKKLLSDLMKTEPFYDDIIDRYAALKDRRIDLI